MWHAMRSFENIYEDNIEEWWKRITQKNGERVMWMKKEKKNNANIKKKIIMTSKAIINMVLKRKVHVKI
jgi:hypothetical protein